MRLRQAVRSMQPNLVVMAQALYLERLDHLRLFYSELAMRDGDMAAAEALLGATAHNEHGGPAQLNWLGQAGASVCGVAVRPTPASTTSGAYPSRLSRASGSPKQSSPGAGEVRGGRW